MGKKKREEERPWSRKKSRWGELEGGLGGKKKEKEEKEKKRRKKGGKDTLKEKKAAWAA